MFRIFKAELKKIFLKPSIYVVTGLIILMIALSSFLYNPIPKSTFLVDTSNVNQLANVNSVSAIYDNFVSTDLNVSYRAETAQQLLQGAKSYIEFYKTNQNSHERILSLANTLEEKLIAYQTAFASYKVAYDSNDAQDIASTQAVLDKARNTFFEAHENFYDTYINVVQNENTTVLVTPALHMQMKNHYSKYEQSYYKNNTELAYYENNLNYLTKLFPSSTNAEFLNTLKSYVNQILPFEIDLTTNYYNIESLEGYITTALERLGNDGKDGNEMTGIFKQIYEFKEANSSASANKDSTNIEEMTRLVTNYHLTAGYANNYVTNAIKINGLEKLGSTIVQSYIPFEKSNLYQMKENLVKIKYLCDTATFEYQYADVLSISQPSNEDINAFDFSYFAIRLSSLFIIVYIVVLAAGTIAGEQSAGTMKLIAIRPYSRNKLLSGKILSVITIGAILLAVCSAATLVIGGISYGFQSAAMLSVINATAVCVAPVWLYYLLAIACTFMEILFYAMLAMFISTLFKSNVGAVIVSVLILFVSLILNVVAINVPILRFLPFTNLNLFKYFGGSFVATNSAQSVLQGILTPSVYVGADAILTSIIYAASVVVLIIASYLKFKNQDIK